MSVKITGCTSLGISVRIDDRNLVVGTWSICYEIGSEAGE